MQSRAFETVLPVTRFMHTPHAMALPISEAEMRVMLDDQIARLDDLTRPTWKQHRVKPERIPMEEPEGRDSYVVARADGEVLYFDDEKDEFARGDLTESGKIREVDSWGLDLALVLRHFPRRRRAETETG